MKPLEDQSNYPTPEQCATLVMETVPLVMRAIRAEMRRRRPADLSVPQFRTLGFLERRPGSSLSDVAEHIGLTLPSISRMVDGLVQRGFVSRLISPADRRRSVLSLTPDGVGALARTRRVTRDHLAETVKALAPAERAAIGRGMHILRAVFSSARDLEEGR